MVVSYNMTQLFKDITVEEKIYVGKCPDCNQDLALVNNSRNKRICEKCCILFKSKEN
jgi:ssDNA-binding Zn-finger/Zn-ribbon topoisomerase 1